MNHILQEILNDQRFPEGSAWQRRVFSNKDMIVEEGQAGGSLFYIESGCLRVSGNIELESKKNIQPGIWELEQGEIFGEIALYQSQFRTASVCAISDVTLVEINGEKLSIYLDDNPQRGYLFYKGLFEILIGRLDRANHRVSDLFAWGLKVHGIKEHL
ncbi:cyclic nucleotide-binding domain-containing protein [sulfur-oxidizing endosymbiont of Gigantopelta aegis]|uniref:cyclic nucleotide-binding domain-containing protein n=1 Tax=sulfur-oxidizing endosymbiont of Gigantopelta aegis TaxID=2794934 RepID=UPI0018DB39E9|nr:cyclic nucleotide-binding domain-containing protein [sulfur-oxidizing endosymbiont of Gigantopelta aegis]